MEIPTIYRTIEWGIGFVLATILGFFFGELIRMIVEWVSRKRATSADPIITIEPYDEVLKEGYATWKHLKIVNEGYSKAKNTNTARGAVVHLHIHGMDKRLLFASTNFRPDPERALIKGIVNKVPLAFVLKRDLKNGEEFYGYRDLKGGLCYITDSEFLTQQVAKPLELCCNGASIYDFDVKVEWWDGGKFIGYFTLTAPNKSGGITIENRRVRY